MGSSTGTLLQLHCFPGQPQPSSRWAAKTSFRYDVSFKTHKTAWKLIQLARAFRWTCELFFSILLNWSLQSNQTIKYLLNHSDPPETWEPEVIFGHTLHEKELLNSNSWHRETGATCKTFDVAWVSLSKLKRLLIWEILWILWGLLWLFQLYFKLEAKPDYNMLKKKEAVQSFCPVLSFCLWIPFLWFWQIRMDLQVQNQYWISECRSRTTMKWKSTN